MLVPYLLLVVVCILLLVSKGLAIQELSCNLPPQYVTFIGNVSVDMVCSAVKKTEASVDGESGGRRPRKRIWWGRRIMAGS